VLSASVPLVEAMIWQGRCSDPSGFYCFGARYYDSLAGRFLSPDPLGHLASMDLYSGFNGDPVNYCDPDGRFFKNVWQSFYEGGTPEGQALQGLGNSSPGRQSRRHLQVSFTNFTTGKSHAFGGTYLELTPHERIRYTDKFDDPNLPGEMRTTIILKQVFCGTELNITQEGIPAAIPVEACYLGWQESLTLLAKLVEAEIPDQP